MYTNDIGICINNLNETIFSRGHRLVKNCANVQWNFRFRSESRYLNGSQCARYGNEGLMEMNNAIIHFVNLSEFS